jgi:hypothetical protein
MKKTLYKFGFAVLVLVCILAFTLPMRHLCACYSPRDELALAFGQDDMTDAQLARAIKTQMEGVDSKKGYAEWNTAYQEQFNSVTDPKDFNKHLPYPAARVSAISWISWFAPDGDPPGGAVPGCAPRSPWKAGQTISCKFYGVGNLFKKNGVQLDFRITPEGVIRDAKLSALSYLLGMETLDTIQ